MPGRSHTTAPGTKEMFTGHERDHEVGLDYMVARRYNPELGRFMSIDPMADSYSSWSPYAYVLNNPVNLIDPTGMCAESGGGPGGPPECFGANREILSFGNADWGGQMSVGEKISLQETARELRKERDKNKSNDGDGDGTKRSGCIGVSCDLTISATALAATGNYGAAGMGASEIFMEHRYQQVTQSSMTYRALGIGRAGLTATGYFATGLSFFSDSQALYHGELDPGLYAYRTTGSLMSIYIGYKVGLVAGGPWGAVAGGAVGGGFALGELFYHRGWPAIRNSVENFQQQFWFQYHQYENGLKRGWTPF